MKTVNAMSLKGKLKNIAVKQNISPHAVLQMYLIECFLERLSFSRFRSNFIVKGGILISAVTTIRQRTTMDLDTTCVGCRFDADELTHMMTEICDVEADDDFIFSLCSCEPIHEQSAYTGLRVHLRAKYESIEAPLSIDVTTGDAITPHEMAFTYPRLFGDSSIAIYSYTIETILAEKLEAILTLTVTNTRPRDFYDVHLLSSVARIDRNMLTKAFRRTCERRGTMRDAAYIDASLAAIKESANIRGHWARYTRLYPYAKDLSFDDVFASIETLLRQMR